MSHNYPEQPERLSFTEADPFDAAVPPPQAPMGLNDFQLRELIIVPTLIHLGLHSDNAVQLLLNTAKQESHLAYLKQLGGGPAVSLWQIEPATHNDIWANFLRYREELAEKVRVLAIGSKQVPDPEQMVGNLFYACAMARIHYLRVPEMLPASDDVMSQALYWKAHYNTELGRGTVEEFMANAGGPDATLTA